MPDPIDLNKVYTIADWIKLKDEDYAGIVYDVLNNFPVFKFLRSIIVPGKTFNHPIVDGLTGGAFRKAYKGKQRSKGSLKTREVNLEYFDASWDMDTREARIKDKGGVASALAFASSLALQGTANDVESQTLYGTKYLADGFLGLLDLVHPDLVVDAGGTATGKCSDVFALTADVKYVLGLDGELRTGEGPIKTRDYDENGNPFWVYAEEVALWLGLIATSKYASGRVANIDLDNPLDDDLLGEVKTRMGVFNQPIAWVMSPRSVEQLRQSRKAYHSAGDPVPYPTHAFGAPILVAGTVLDNRNPAA